MSMCVCDGDTYIVRYIPAVAGLIFAVSTTCTASNFSIHRGEIGKSAA